MPIVFWRDIALPIIVALLALSVILFIVNLILRLFRLDIPILRLAGLLVLWYYLGPLIYNWLLQKVIVINYDLIEIIYTPIQKIIEAFEKIM